MTTEEALNTCRAITQDSLGELAGIIDFLNKGEFSAKEDSQSLKIEISNKIQSMAMEEYIPYISALETINIIEGRSISLKDFYYNVSYEYDSLWHRVAGYSDWVGNPSNSKIHIYNAYDIESACNQIEYDYHKYHTNTCVFLLTDRMSISSCIERMKSCSIGYNLFLILELEVKPAVGLLFFSSLIDLAPEDQKDYHPGEGKKHDCRIFPDRICRMVYCSKDGQVHNYQSFPGLPKFIYLIQQKKDKEAGKISICKERHSINEGEEYYCIDRRDREDRRPNHFDYSRQFSGDPELKKAINLVKSPYSLKEQRIAKSPSIIIDCNTMKAISFIKRGLNNESSFFLLDDSHFAFTLKEDYLRERKTDYSRYGTAAARINEDLNNYFISLESKLSSVPGLEYHCNRQHRSVFLSEILPTILYGKKNKFKQSEKPVEFIFDPCGFDISKYLNRLQESKNEYTKPYICKNAHENGVGIYTRVDNCDKSDLVLIAFILNCLISEKYDDLDEGEGQSIISENPSTKKEWDLLYNQNHWCSKNVNIDPSDRRYRLQPFSWRKIKNSKTFTFTDGERIREFEEKYQFRTAYFKGLLSIDEKSLASLKSSATDPKKVNANKKVLLKCIFDVLKESGDKKIKPIQTNESHSSE